MSFDIPLHTFVYSHEYHKHPAASTRLTLTPTPTLSWRYLHGSWPNSNFHGSTSKYIKGLIPWKLELFAWKLASMEVDLSRWKLSWNSVKLLNEATPMAISMEVHESKGSWWKLPWKLICFRGSWWNYLSWKISFHGSKFTFMEVGGSFHGSWFTSTEVRRIFHGSRWQCSWK